MIAGVYETMRRNMKGKMNMYSEGVYASVDPSMLPNNLEAEIMLDIGENSMLTCYRSYSRLVALCCLH